MPAYFPPPADDDDREDMGRLMNTPPHGHGHAGVHGDPPAEYRAPATGEFEPAPLLALFSNLRTWNEFAVRVGMGHLEVTSITIDGDVYPDADCVATPGGGCLLCSALTTHLDKGDEHVDRMPPWFEGLSHAAAESADCTDCQNEVIAEALGEEPPKPCICNPAESADCDPRCEAAGCNA